MAAFGSSVGHVRTCVRASSVCVCVESFFFVRIVPCACAQRSPTASLTHLSVVGRKGPNGGGVRGKIIAQVTVGVGVSGCVGE